MCVVQVFGPGERGEMFWKWGRYVQGGWAGFVIEENVGIRGMCVAWVCGERKEPRCML